MREIFYLFEKKVISLQLVLSADFINVIHLTMKKLFLLGMMCLMALSMQAQNSCVELDFQLGTNITDCGGSVSSSSADDSTGYTDLGLLGRTKSRVPVVVERKWIQGHGSQRQFHRVARLGRPQLRRKCLLRGVRRQLLVVYAQGLRLRVVPLLLFRRSARGQRPPLPRSIRPACPRLMIALARVQSQDIKDYSLLLNSLHKF